MSILTTLGSGSGIDTKQLVADLVASQRAGTESVLKTRQATVDAKISSLSQVSSALSDFSTALNSLVNSGVLGRQVTSSDSSVVSASLSGTGSPANISTSIEVQQLAQWQTVAATAVADKNASIGQGTLTINFCAVSGTLPTPAGFAPSGAAPVTITIGPENDSLVGLQQAINQSGAGLKASIVQDNDGARLVIKGATGAAQGFTIDASAGLEAFSFGTGAGGMGWTTAAQNSVLLVDGVMIEKQTNSITDVVDGVKLDLQKASVGTTVQLNVNYDTETLKTAVSNYVDVYNELMGMLNTATRISTDGSDAGPLANDRTIRDLKRTLSSLSSQSLLNGAGPASLAEIGIKTNRDGTLSIDATRLSNAVSQYPDRVHDMFVPNQTSSSPLLSVASKLGAVKPGSYAVTDVVAATSGKYAGTAVPTAFDVPVVIDASNKIYSVTLDGRTSLTLNLPEGSYTSGAALASAFQSTINADSVLSSFGLKLDVAWDGSSFTFKSRNFGSTSSVALTGLDAALSDTLGLTGAASSIGTNASGKIGGVNAIGMGNRLVASLTSSASGLAVTVLGSVPSASITVRDTVSTVIADIQKRLSAKDGGLATLSDRLSKEARDIADQQDRLEASSLSLQTRLTNQFAAMEKAVAAFKNTQSYLQQQIDSWNSSNN